MKRFHPFLFAGLLVAFFVTACAPNASQLKKVVEENPEIIFNAIEKNPQKFLETVNVAAREAREQEAKKMADAEDQRREDEFKNPKSPVIQADRAIKGDKDAPVTIVEYSDFQCPFCKRGASTVDRIMDDYKGKVRLVFKHFPIERIHPQAKLTSQYFEAIALQDPSKAYKFKEYVFENQEQIRDREDKFLDEAAKKAGANLAQVKANLNSDKVLKRIAEDMKEAENFGFSGTPGYLINGVSLKGAYPYEEFKRIIDRHLGGGESADNSADTESKEG